MAKVKEEWKEHPEAKGLFVSNLGRIKSHRRKVPKLLRLHANRLGYICFNTTMNGKPRAFRVHQCVGVTFLGGPTKIKTNVNHKNAIKSDNRVVNLEYCSPHENAKHAYKNNLKNMSKGEDNNKSKLTEKQVLKIFYSKDSCTSLAKKYKVGHSAICAIWNKITWKHITKDLENGRVIDRSKRQANGERNARAKLTASQVRKIMKDERLQSEISKDYGIGGRAISSIKAKRTWKHLWKD